MILRYFACQVKTQVLFWVGKVLLASWAIGQKSYEAGIRRSQIGDRLLDDVTGAIYSAIGAEYAPEWCLDHSIWISRFIKTLNRPENGTTMRRVGRAGRMAASH
jgi:hypothetical protein